jgi:CheY-like chemotaxis protein
MRDILIVDDNPLLVSVLSEMLKAHGHAVRTASDGFAALATIREQSPDVLLSDLNMPGMSGFELLSVVRRRFPNIAVIAMSGAYSGRSIPLGIAADGFYAKGSCSISGLFEILNAIEDDEVRHSTRAEAPVWIPGIPIHQGDLRTMYVACPECLRTFAHSAREAPAPPEERRCPHCQYAVQLAIVMQLEEMDKTFLRLSVTPQGASESPVLRRRDSEIYFGYPAP